MRLWRRGRIFPTFCSFWNDFEANGQAAQLRQALLSREGDRLRSLPMRKPQAKEA